MIVTRLRFAALVSLQLSILTGVAVSSLAAKDWPSGQSPRELGISTANHIAGDHLGAIDAGSLFSAYGIIRLAEAVNSRELLRRIEETYGSVLAGQAASEKLATPGLAEWLGIVAFELYEETTNERYLASGVRLATQRFGSPAGWRIQQSTRQSSPDPFETVGEKIFRPGVFLGQAYRATEDLDLVDLGTSILKDHQTALQQPSGIYLSGKDGDSTAGARGNGWAAAGLTEVLVRIRGDHTRAAGVPGQEEHFKTLRDSHDAQMAALLERQTESGMWREVLDDASSDEDPIGTALIIFATASGVIEGWLAEELFRESAERGWLALSKAAGKLPHGDASAGGALLLAASAMVRLETAPWLKGNRKTPRDKFEVVKNFADTLIARGRDTYGMEHSPLFASMLDRETLRLPSKEERNRLWKLKFVDGKNWPYRNRDRVFTGSNPQHHEDLFQILYALTKITGDGNYARQADRAIAWFFNRCQSASTGLLPWGEHMGWDFETETMIWHSGIHNGGILLECITHEFAKPWVLWERTFELAPEAATRFAKGLWDHQIHDHETGTFSRHAIYTVHRTFPDSEFPRHGGFYIASWAEAFKRTKDPIFLKALEVLVDHFERNRSPKSGIIPAVSPGKIAWPFSNISLAIDLTDGAKKVEGPVAQKMLRCALRTDEILLRLPMDCSAGGKGFAGTVDYHTLKPAERGGFTGLGNGRETGLATSFATRYRQTGNKAFRKPVVDAARNYLSTEFDLEVAVPPGSFGGVIWLLLEAHDFTKEEAFLERADHFATQAIELFFGDGLPLPKANSKYAHYEAATGGDRLTMTLLRLWMVQNGRGDEAEFRHTGR